MTMFHMFYMCASCNGYMVTKTSAWNANECTRIQSTNLGAPPVLASSLSSHSTV
eukprot:m.56759 g.56759  ORF g.56759 m.56759 type:complete len:54 (-) comp15593_c0_seq1:213-374(-)